MRRRRPAVVYALVMGAWLVGNSHAISSGEECPMIYWPRFQTYYGEGLMSHHPLVWNDSKPVREKFLSFGDTVIGDVWKYPEIVPRRKVKDGRPRALVVVGEACDTTLEWKAVLAHDSLEFREKIDQYRVLVRKGYRDSAEAFLRPLDVPIRSVFRLRKGRGRKGRIRMLVNGIAVGEIRDYPAGDSTQRIGRRSGRQRELPPKAGRFFLTIETDRFLEEGGYTVIFGMDREEIESGKAEAYADKFIAGIVNIEEKEWVKPDSTWTRSYPRYKMTVIRGRLRSESSRVQYRPSILPKRP